MAARGWARRAAPRPRGGRAAKARLPRGEHRAPARPGPSAGAAAPPGAAAPRPRRREGAGPAAVAPPPLWPDGARRVAARRPLGPAAARKAPAAPAPRGGCPAPAAHRVGGRALAANPRGSLPWAVIAEKKKQPQTKKTNRTKKKNPTGKKDISRHTPRLPTVQRASRPPSAERGTQRERRGSCGCLSSSGGGSTLPARDRRRGGGRTRRRLSVSHPGWWEEAHG